ncbi:MAG TPA: riboflavin synthase [Gammaproteobacteria bacterium]|nr:riboflavin synthase [Gammaproteobacteria bacterium]
MFTGIIQAIGSLKSLTPSGGDQRIVVEVGKLDMQSVQLGDSIAVNGVCLTAIEFDQYSFAADVSNETLECTTLGNLNAGDPVNLEKALLPTTHLGGHLVSGHVDGVGEIISRSEDGRSIQFEIRVPEALSRYIAAKGSICVDGISLTVNNIENDTFVLNIVPHTLVETNLGSAKVGGQVNLEVDIIARYLERLLSGGKDNAPQSELTAEKIMQAGFN